MPTLITACEHERRSRAGRWGATGQQHSTLCDCPCDYCRPDLTDEEVAALQRRLNPLADALFVAAMMFLTVEGLS
jgi:hypothetical protein